MTNLTGQTPYATYRDLLTVTHGGQGLPQDTLVPVQDGAGHNSPMLMSQNAVQFTKVMAVPWQKDQKIRSQEQWDSIQKRMCWKYGMGRNGGVMNE
jgi:hypothetical protein